MASSATSLADRGRQPPVTQQLLDRGQADALAIQPRRARVPEHVRGELGDRAAQVRRRGLGQRPREGLPADRAAPLGREQHRPRQLPLIAELAADVLDPPDQQRPGITEHRHHPLPGPGTARALAQPHVDLAERAVAEVQVLQPQPAQLPQPQPGRSRDCRMVAVQAEFADQHAELAVGLQLVVGRPGANLRVPARILRPAIALLPGDSPAHAGEFRRGDLGRGLAGQFTPGHRPRRRVIRGEKESDGVAPQLSHPVSLLVAQRPRQLGSQHGWFREPVAG